MNYEAQVSAICKSSFFYVRNGLFIWKYLYADSIKKLVHAFIIVTWTAATNCFMLFFRIFFNGFKWYRAVPCDWYLIRESLTMSLLSWWICNGFPSSSVWSSRFWLSLINHQIVLSLSTSVIHWIDIS